MGQRAPRERATNIPRLTGECRKATASWTRKGDAREFRLYCGYVGGSGTGCGRGSECCLVISFGVFIPLILRVLALGVFIWEFRSCIVRHIPISYFLAHTRNTLAIYTIFTSLCPESVFSRSSTCLSSVFIPTLN